MLDEDEAIPAPEPKRHIVNQEKLPPSFPTQAHRPEFWEALGRTVATFGFLENTLGRAIFAVTGTTELSDDPALREAAVQSWPRTLERALSDPLGNLIDSFGKAVRENSHATITNVDALLDQLRDAARIRNVLCHGFWQMPDAGGKSTPFFVSKRIEVFDTAIDVAFLDQVRTATVEMACGVMDVVTHMGWQFPGSSGPGKPVWTA